MINGLPNMACVFGYFRHSWTLRADLVSDLVGRLLVKMRDKGATMVVPALRPQDTDMQLRPWADSENFNPGYVMRSRHILFKQGDREPWTLLAGARAGARDPAGGGPRQRDARLLLSPGTPSTWWPSRPARSRPHERRNHSWLSSGVCKA